MQRVIHPLSEQCINQIAAGEVIERPASVVKELLENAIDAQASSIQIHLFHGGIKGIEIRDDGLGMCKEDLELCYLRHTTSKLADPEEIFSLLTNGFRGEALSSIASVSKMQILSRATLQDTGWEIELEQGQLLRDPQERTRSQGTTILVQDLFFNTPVRRKFLGTSQSEGNRCADIVSRIALAHPEVAISLEKDGQEILHLNSGTSEQRIQQIFGIPLARKMLAISATEGKNSIYGYVGNEETGQLRRLKQYFYLDRRPVENFHLSRALERAWQSFYPGKHPPAVLFFDLPRLEYDINVHPTKKEIRFAQPDLILSHIQKLLRRAIEDVLRPQINPGSGLPQQIAETYPLSSSFKDFDFLAQLESPPSRVESQDLFNTNMTSLHFGSSSQNQDPDTIDSGSPYQEEMQAFQWAQKFIVAETGSGLLVIDQYKAHLRINYDRSLVNLAQSKCLPSQQLLFPEVIDLIPEYADLLEQHADLFFILAYDVEPFGKNAFRLRGIPSDLPASQAKEALEMILAELEQNPKGDFKERLALAYAYAASIHRNQVLKKAEISTLVHDLFACQNPYVCPKGRAIFHRLALDEIERKLL